VSVNRDSNPDSLNKIGEVLTLAFAKDPLLQWLLKLDAVPWTTFDPRVRHMQCQRVAKLAEEGRDACLLTNRSPGGIQKCSAVALIIPAASWASWLDFGWIASLLRSALNKQYDSLG
jgi:hypothetical protein